MAMTEAQRKANQKWDKMNNTTLALKTRKDKAEAFKAACKENGTSPNAVFNEAMNAFVEAHGGWFYWMNETKSEETEE